MALLYVRLGKYFLCSAKSLTKDCNKSLKNWQRVFLSEKFLYISGVDDLAGVGAHSVKATVFVSFVFPVVFLYVEFFNVGKHP